MACREHSGALVCACFLLCVLVIPANPTRSIVFVSFSCLPPFSPSPTSRSGVWDFAQFQELAQDLVRGHRHAIAPAASAAGGFGFPELLQLRADRLKRDKQRAEQAAQIQEAKQAAKEKLKAELEVSPVSAQSQQ